MRAICFHACALTCSVLFAVPAWSAAQTVSSSAAASPNRTSIATVSDSSVPSLEELGLPGVSVQSDAQSQDQDQENKGQKTPPANNGLSLQGLGFSASQTQGNAQEQARLNKRTHMLKVHQTLGLITLAPMVATLFTGGGAKTKRGPGGTYTEPSSGSLDFHVALGATTGALYAATAYYAFAAPRIHGVKPTGAIRLHRDLVWVHAPGMVLTGILGMMAYNQESNGEKVHGIASAHGAVAGVTVAAYAASIVAVSWPIHLKFWEKK